MAIRTSSQAGNWSSSSTWGGAAAPGDGDQFIINGHAIVADSNITVGLSCPKTPDGETGVLQTVANTGTSGATSLSTGTRRCRYTYVDSNGNEGHYSPSVSMGTITSGVSVPRITFSTLPTGVSGRNVYLTDAGGSAGNERLYATGVTGLTFDPVSADFMDGTIAFASATALPNRTAGMINSSGSLLIDDGTTFITRGDIYLNGTTLTVDPGATFEFDASASVGTTNTYYAVRNGTGVGTNANAKFITQGTSLSRCTVTSNASGGNGYIGPLLDVSTGWQINGGLITLAHTDFSRLGSSSRHSFAIAQQSGTHTIDIDNCTFDTCGRLLGLFTMTATSIFNMVDTKFDNSLHDGASTDDSINLNHATPSGGGSFAITRCFFDKLAILPNACDKIDSVFKVGVNYPGAVTVKGVMTGCMWSKIGSSAGSLQTINEDITDCYFYQDPTDGGSGNPQGITPSAGIASLDGVCVIDGCIFESDNDAFDGDMITTRGGVLTTAIRCIGIPSGKSPRDSSGTMFTQFGSAGTPPRLAAIHCTWFVGRNSALQVGESTAANAGDVDSFLSNISYTDSGLSNGYGPKCHITVINGAATDTLDAADADYNCGWNLGTGTSGIPGYNLNFTGTPGVHDVNEDPDFVDDTRDLAAWAVLKGSVSSDQADKIQDAFTYLKADPTLVRLDLIPWIREGFVPQNENLRYAAHDGTTIGACQMPAISGLLNLYRVNMAGGMFEMTGGMRG